MDAKSRDLALLTALSLSCAGVALISDYLVLASVFFTLGFGFGLFYARSSRRSRHSLAAVTAPRLPARPASGAMTITTCLPMASWSAAS
jgi:hypothetical protein